VPRAERERRVAIGFQCEIGQHDHFGSVRHLAHGAQHAEAGAAAQLQVEYHDVDVAVVDRLDGVRFRAHALGDADTGHAIDDGGDEVADDRRILDKQNLKF
jgi:hypothetical protein